MSSSSSNNNTQNPPPPAPAASNKENSFHCCNASHPNEKASVYCGLCKKFYCAECETSIHKPCFSTHRAIKISDSNPGSVVPFTGMCQQHPGYPLDYFCNTHYCLCCTECTIREGCHSRCAVGKFSTVNMDTMMQYTKQTIKDADKLFAGVVNLLDIIKDLEESHSREIEEQVLQLHKTFEALKESLDKREAELIKGLEEEREKGGYSRVASELERSSKEAKAHYSMLEGTVNAWDELDPKDRVDRVCTAYHALGNLWRSSESAVDAMCRKGKVTFSQDDTLAEDIDNFGSIKVSRIQTASVLSVVGHPTSHEVKLSWSPAPFNSPGYRVVMRLGKDNTFKTVYEGIGTECTVSDLTPRQNHTFGLHVGVHGIWGSIGNLVNVSTQPES